MEYRYCRELKHNYLILKDEELRTDNDKNYQMKILEKRKLEGFLPCDLRVINNESYLYYEVNSMQSIYDRFSAKGMDQNQLKELFLSMKAAINNLEEYLLGIENVVLDSKSIFVDLTTGEFKFMYCPFYRGDFCFSGFVDELFEIVDHEDENAVEIIYSLSEKAQIEGFLLTDCIEQVIEMPNKSMNQTEMINTVQDTEELSNKSEYPIEDYEEEPYEEPEEKKKSTGASSGKVQLVFSGLFFFLLIAMMYIRMNYILSKEENTLSMIVLAISVLSGLVSFLSGIRDYLSGRNRKASDTKGEKETDDSINDFYDYPSETTENVNDSDGFNIDGYRQQVNITPSQSERTFKTVSNETIVLGEDPDMEKGITLYSRNLDKTMRISLDKLPVTIGKLEGCVDKVISDMSVSRIHCRFIKTKEGKIALTDLNSTNGTYKNGLRLNPQEENYIEEGDEVRIGRICFDCR